MERDYSIKTLIHSQFRKPSLAVKKSDVSACQKPRVGSLPGVSVSALDRPYRFKVANFNDGEFSGRHSRNGPRSLQAS